MRSPHGYTLAEHIVSLIDSSILLNDQGIEELVLHPTHHRCMAQDRVYSTHVTKLNATPEDKEETYIRGVKINEDHKCMVPYILLKDGQKISM